jgi:hypothetical protein
MNEYNRVLFTNKDNTTEIKRALDTFFKFIIDDVLAYLIQLINYTIKSEILTTLNNIVVKKYALGYNFDSQRDEILQDFLNNNDNITLLINNICNTLNEKLNTNTIVKRNMDLVYKIISITKDNKKMKTINDIITKYYKDNSNQNLSDSTRLIFNNNLEMIILSRIKDYTVDSMTIQNEIINMIKSKLLSIKIAKNKIDTSDKFIDIFTNMDYTKDVKNVINKHSVVVEKFNTNMFNKTTILLFIIIIAILIFVSLMVSGGITMKCLTDKCTTNENLSRLFLSLSALFFIIFIIKS